MNYHSPIKPSPPILDFFFELECPFCRRVRYEILLDMVMKHKIQLNKVNVDTSYGCEEMQWYRRFCRQVEEELTPVIRIATPGITHVFIMFKKKPLTLTEEVLSSEEILKKKLYDRLRQMENEGIILPQQTYFEEKKSILKEVGIIA
jgi:hypothetical protein